MRYDPLTKKERSQRMSLVKSKNTKPEIYIRKLVHSLGYRYRLHDKSLPGKPDLVFKSKQKVIFVHGCFWHLHECGTYNFPKTKTEFWHDKLTKNRERDQLTIDKLKMLGYDALIIWSCQLKNVEKLKNRIVNFLE